MRETYQKAMDHLEFAPLSAQNILACHRQSRRGGRFLSAAAVAACTCLLTLATVFAVNPQFRADVLSLLRVGSTAADATQANYTTTVTTLNADITYSYLTLPQGSDGADIQDGVLFDGQHFWAVTQDNRLQQLPGSVVDREITWDGWSVALHFAWGCDGEKLYVRQLSDSWPRRRSARPVCGAAAPYLGKGHLL